MRKDWNGLLKIHEIWKTNAAGNVIWRDSNLFNTFHLAGEEFILKSVFAGGKTDNAFIPEYYYFGLDNRANVTVDDTMETIMEDGNEPNNHGYARVRAASEGIFAVSLRNNHFRADGPILVYSSTGAGGWGPVNNLFLTTTDDNLGTLIATVPLTQEITLGPSENLNVIMGLSLKDC